MFTILGIPDPTALASLITVITDCHKTNTPCHTTYKKVRGHDEQ